jgi:hypothetical protein
MEAKRLELTDLKEKLRKLKVDTTLTLRYARKEASARTEGGVRQFSAEEADLLADIDDTRKKIDTERAVHEQTMEILRRGACQALYERLAVSGGEGWKGGSNPRRGRRASAACTTTRGISTHTCSILKGLQRILAPKR